MLTVNDLRAWPFWLAVLVGCAALVVVGLAGSRSTSIRRAVTGLAVMAVLSWAAIAASGRLGEWAAGMWITTTWLVGVRLVVRRSTGH